MTAAASNGYLSVVEYLVDNGADVNKKDTAGNTALKWATEKSHHEVVEYLENIK